MATHRIHDKPRHNAECRFVPSPAQMICYVDVLQRRTDVRTSSSWPWPPCRGSRRTPPACVLPPTSSACSVAKQTLRSLGLTRCMNGQAVSPREFVSIMLKAQAAALRGDARAVIGQHAPLLGLADLVLRRVLDDVRVEPVPHVHIGHRAARLHVNMCIGWE